MSKFLLFATFAFSFHSFADLKVTPVVPISCEQAKPTDVTMVTALPAVTQGDSLSFSLLMTFANCHSGRYEMKPIAESFNFYLLEMEHSPDFQSNYQVVGAGHSDIALDMSLKPAQFFAVTSQRHFEMRFYPDQSSLSFGWKLVFTQDPQTKSVSLQAFPL